MVGQGGDSQRWAPAVAPAAAVVVVAWEPAGARQAEPQGTTAAAASVVSLAVASQLKRHYGCWENYHHQLRLQRQLQRRLQHEERAGVAERRAVDRRCCVFAVANELHHWRQLAAGLAVRGVPHLVVLCDHSLVH